MKREIKFRIWCNIDKEMSSFEIIRVLPDEKNLSEVFEDDSVIWMQYIGLKDRNGKEIYEGDIVSSENWNPRIYQVGFDRGGFCFYNEGDSYYIDCKYLEDFEVIGNIYENHDLLEKAETPQSDKPKS